MRQRIAALKIDCVPLSHDGSREHRNDFILERVVDGFLKQADTQSSP